MKKWQLKKHLSKKNYVAFTVAAIILLLVVTPTLGRFIYKGIKNFYFLTKSFYFNSDKLSESVSRLTLENWNGVDPYTITINMNSKKNERLKATSDISYNISYTCSSNLDCYSNKTSSVIYSATNEDEFTVTLSPNTTLSDGDTVWMQVKAESTDPYKKTIEGIYTLKVGSYGLSYEITDNPDDIYAELKITNTLDYYKVITAFDTYSVGDLLEISEYQALSTTNKKNCTSAVVNLSFDPNKLLLDLTSETYLNNLETKTTKIGSYDYINYLSFGIEAVSSEIIRFYKVDTSQDYTYDGTGTSIIGVEFK